MMDSGRLNSMVDSASYRSLQHSSAIARIASVRDFQSDWRRWTATERIFAVGIVAGLLAVLSSMSGMVGH